MTKNKSVNFTFFKNAQEETNSSPVQIQITLPDGVNVSIKVEKTLPDGKKLAEQDQATTVQYTSAPEIFQNKNDDPVLVPALIEAKKTSPGWPRPSFQLPEKIHRWLGSEKEWMKYLPEILFGVSILIYLLVRLIGLTDYPGYFNFDEADKTVLASDFLRDGFRNYGGELFPAFFPNPGNNYNVGSAAVYLQIVPMLIFGRSDYVIRATSVLVGLIGAICVSLALRNIFRARYWWAGILVLSVIPAWFHHSRTGYEMPTFVSFYSAMLYCYWMYRFHKPVYLYPAVLFSALAFYDYSPGQALIPLTIVALFVLDFPYHLRMRNSTLGAAGLGILCVVPYIRFQISHAGNSAAVLSNVGSYWVQDLPIASHALEIHGVRITWCPVWHPQECLAYRLEVDGKAYVVATDREHGHPDLDPPFVQFCRNADVLVHDAQYLPEEYPRHRGWGHSTFQAAAAVACTANVGRLLLTHHDCGRADDEVDRLVEQARLLFPNTEAAAEGMQLGG